MEPSQTGGAFVTASLVALLGFVLTVPITLIIKAWLVDTVIEFPMAIGGIIVVLTMVAVAWSTQGTFWILLVVALLLGACVGMPFFVEKQNKLALKEIRDDDISRYRNAIDRDPNNASAYAYLGDALLERGSHVAAIAQYEKAVALSPENGKWSRKLERARAEQPVTH